MLNATEKMIVERDLEVMWAMVAEMPAFLKHNTLFYPLNKLNYPRLTMGGLLMRQYRLGEIINQTNGTLQARYNEANLQFNNTIQEHVVAVEDKANAEADTRIRQWQTALNEWLENGGNDGYTVNLTEVRTFIAHLITFLQTYPFHLHASLVEKLIETDSIWKTHWQGENFIGDKVWRPAYPPQKFWWLYGQPNL